MASLGDIYRVINEFNLEDGQRAITTQYYRVTTAGSGGAFNLNASYAAKFDSAALGLLNEDHELLYRQVINGMDNSDYIEITPQDSGTRTGASLPSALTPVFRSARDQPGDRYSWQRWPFGSVSDLVQTGLWASGFGTGLASFANLLDDTMSLGTGEIVEPCQITGGFKLGTDPVFVRPLTGEWAYGVQAHWLESRQPTYTYTTS